MRSSSGHFAEMAGAAAFVAGDVIFASDVIVGGCEIGMVEEEEEEEEDKIDEGGGREIVEEGLSLLIKRAWNGEESPSVDGVCVMTSSCCCCCCCCPSSSSQILTAENNIFLKVVVVFLRNEKIYIFMRVLKLL